MNLFMRFVLQFYIVNCYSRRLGFALVRERLGFCRPQKSIGLQRKSQEVSKLEGVEDCDGLVC